MQLPWRKKEALLALKTQSDEPVYLTADGLRRMQEKLARLKADLPRFAEEAGRTADYGDRSENAEYKDAKANLRRTQNQIFSIEDQLKRVIVIEAGVHTSGVVQLGSTVTIESTDGAQKIFQIVGPKETNPTSGRISHESPLGKALMQRVVGDTISVVTPNGTRPYIIRTII